MRDGPGKQCFYYLKSERLRAQDEAQASAGFQKSLKIGWTPNMTKDNFHGVSNVEALISRGPQTRVQ